MRPSFVRFLSEVSALGTEHSSLAFTWTTPLLYYVDSVDVGSSVASVRVIDVPSRRISHVSISRLSAATRSALLGRWQRTSLVQQMTLVIQPMSVWPYNHNDITAAHLPPVSVSPLSGNARTSSTATHASTSSVEAAEHVTVMDDAPITFAVRPRPRDDDDRQHEVTEL